jgi:DNA processing protein
MKIKKLTLGAADFPEVLRNIPAPPKQLFVLGDLEGLLDRHIVAIVGARKMSLYGKQVSIRLASELAERGIVIVSGLAMGVDSTAHRNALDVGGQAIAVLPSPLDNIVPAMNRRLAEEIIKSGGALVSEYGPGEATYKQNFIARNRLVSGLSKIVLITEAGEKSGALHTASFALKQGKHVMAVPGNINAPGSIGTNNLIKAGHAQATTSSIDVLHELGLNIKSTKPKARGSNQQEQTILELLEQGLSDGEVVFNRSKLSASEYNQALTMLEIVGKIRPLGANHWAIY